MPDVPFSENPWRGARRFPVAPGRFVAPLLLLAAFAVPPSPDGQSLLGLPCLCGFRMLTGLPCPGCGLTRGIIACAHGRIGESFVYHPISPILLAMLLCRVVYDVRGVPPPDGAATKLSALVVFLLGIVWVLRLCQQS